MIDTAAITDIIHLPQVTVSPQAHALEHSLEVQLPFLQSILTDFSIVPLVVGMASAEEVAEVLDCLWGSEETLIIVSSDLSHYLPYAIAQREDSKTISSILQLNHTVDHEQACGAMPINGLMLAARKHHLTSHLLDLRNSGDTAGPREQVVVYVHLFSHRPIHRLGILTILSDQGRELLSIARAAIARALNVAYRLESDERVPWLQELGACFVTLMQDGKLRGCIGSLEAQRSLLMDVKRNAVSAALHDPRFAPLLTAEFDDTHIEILLLSSRLAMPVQDEADALAHLRLDIDGIVFEYGCYRSTFLPQVWQEAFTASSIFRHVEAEGRVTCRFLGRRDQAVALYRNQMA